MATPRDIAFAESGEITAIKKTTQRDAVTFVDPPL